MEDIGGGLSLALGIEEVDCAGGERGRGVEGWLSHVQMRQENTISDYRHTKAFAICLRQTLRAAVVADRLFCRRVTVEDSGLNLQ